MDLLPMAPSCALDEAGLVSQLERYRQIGVGAHLVDRIPSRAVLDLDGGVDLQLVGEAIAIERECCPFFDLSWVPERRRLTIAVSRPDQEPAIEAILFALNLETTDRYAESD
jgi:hypothetical protein